MTPKEKAQELFCKFYLVKDATGFVKITIHEAKQCALIAVDEILKEVDIYELQFWQQVKNEIEKI